MKSLPLFAAALAFVVAACGSTSGQQSGTAEVDTASGEDASTAGARGLFDLVVNDSVDAASGDNTDYKYIDVEERGSMTVRVRFMNPVVGGTVSIHNDYGEMLREEPVSVGQQEVLIPNFDVTPARYYIRVFASQGSSDYAIGRELATAVAGTGDGSSGTGSTSGTDDSGAHGTDSSSSSGDGSSGSSSGSDDDAERERRRQERRDRERRERERREREAAGSGDGSSGSDSGSSSGSDSGSSSGSDSGSSSGSDSGSTSGSDSGSSSGSDSGSSGSDSGSSSGSNAGDSSSSGNNGDDANDDITASIVNLRVRSDGGTTLILRGCGSSSGLSEGARGRVSGTSARATLTRITGADSCEAESDDSIGTITGSSAVVF